MFLFFAELFDLAIRCFHVNGVELHSKIAAECRAEFLAQNLLFCFFFLGKTNGLLLSGKFIEAIGSFAHKNPSLRLHFLRFIFT